MKISIVGTGHVANALGKVFRKAGHEIVWVYGRDAKKAKRLAELLQTGTIENLNETSKNNPDVIFIAVNDDAIASVSKQLTSPKTIIVHTSGSVSLDVLKKNHKRCGVFYPLQTFSDGSKINFKTTPLCIESNTEKDLQLLLKLGWSVSKSVYVIDSLQRMHIHLAAVVANNFSNHLFEIASRILSEQNLSFDLLRPIILTAAKNIQHHSPALSQTGPAKRGDKLIIQKHLAMLQKHPAWKDLYTLLSKDIERNHKA